VPFLDNVEKYGRDRQRPEMTIYYGACTLRAGYLRLQTHTHNM